MKSLAILVLMFVNSRPMIGLPLKKVVFPSDSEESNEVFWDIGMNNGKDEIGVNEDIKSKLQFRIDAAKVPCANSTVRFCEKVGQQLYPTQYVNSVLQKSGDRYAEFFNKIEFRDDFPEPTINLCDTYTRIVYPEIAMNTDSDWRFVINTKDTRQQIRVELCQKRSSQCQFGESFPAGYVSSCTQKFGKIPLLSFDDNGNISVYEYEFPSHCQCDLHQTKPPKNRAQ